MRWTARRVVGSAGRLPGIALVALALVSCAADSSAPAAPLPGTTGRTASSSPGPASPTAGAPRAQVLAAYLGYWDAVLRAHRTANPAEPELARHAAEPELTKVRQTVSRNKIQNLSLRGTVTHRPSVTVVDASTAQVDDCYDSTGWNPVSLRTGQPIAAVPENGTGRYRARFALRSAGGGRWRVIRSSELGGC